MLVSRNVFHVVSALQSFALVEFYVGSACLVVCGPLQLFSLSFMSFWAVGLSDPIRCVKAWYWPCSFKSLGWLCPAAFIFFAFRDTNRDTLVFLRPETLDVATRVSWRK